MDVIRERECKDTIERQLSEERKLRGKSLFKNYNYLQRKYASPNNLVTDTIPYMKDYFN